MAKKLKNRHPKPNRIFVSSYTKNEDTNNSNQRREKPSNSYLKNLKLYLSQYCESTTIHGIKYVGERGRYFMEKLIWIIIVGLICILCSVFIRQTYVKWLTSPVVVTFETTETAISEIHFPAVTVCPEVKFDTGIFNFTNTVIRKRLYNNLTNKEEDYLQASLLICDNIFGLLAMEYKSHTVELRILDNLFDMIPEFVSRIQRATWLGENASLQVSATSEGLCGTFNMLPYDEILRVGDHSEKSNGRKWSLEEGYPPGENQETYPKRTFMSGLEGGLTLDAIFTNHSHLDILCKRSQQGYKVTLHHPTELPNVGNHFLLPLDQAVLVAVKPKMITVSKEVFHYEPQHRQCYFPGEKYLSLFKAYTQQNCLTECFANHTVSRCGCFPFYLSLYFRHGKPCGPGSNPCVRSSKIKYLEIGNSSNVHNQKCGCLPSCVSLSYEVETSQSDWYWQHIHAVASKIYPNETTPTGGHYSRLVVFYKDLQFLSSKRIEMYDYLDFFSNLGGLLGLFIGFSVTSVVEILYFSTLRVICNIKKFGKDTWSGEPELMNGRIKDGQRK